MDAVAKLPVQSQDLAPRSVTILGSTGTIGRQTLEILKQHEDHFHVVALTAYSNVELLAAQAISSHAKLAVIGDEKKFNELKAALSGTGIEAAAGEQAIVDSVHLRADCYMAAIVGVAGLRPTYEALRQGTRVALANKECLVSAGSIFMDGVKACSTTLLPVDSEHSAIFQALEGSDGDDIKRVTLTASGGPFRSWSAEQLAKATAKEALCHPTWDMGRKITIDSATMMNKGLELIEAFHLFPVEADQLDVIVHPQSIVHCLIEFKDGSTLAQMSSPDMRLPIAYSLSWPRRITTPGKPLTVMDLASMTFEEPDEVRFPALRIARDVLNEGGASGTIFNAANEVAVEAYLSGRIGFMSIPALVEEVLASAPGKLQVGALSTVEDVLDLDLSVRSLADVLLDTI